MKTTMNAVCAVKSVYFGNVPVAPGEVTVVTSDSAQDTVRHSSKIASQIADGGMNVLIINCGISPVRFMAHLEKAHGGIRMKAAHPQLLIYNSMMGNLIGEQEAVMQFIREGRIGTVILTGWEFASSNYRRVQSMMFFLRKMMYEEDVALVIYAHCARNAVAGKIDRGGLGRLSMLAAHIVKIDSSEGIEDHVVKPPTLIYQSDEKQAMGEVVRRAQLIINKTNELQTPIGGRSSTEPYSLQRDDGEGSEPVLV